MKTPKRVKGYVATWPDGAVTEVQCKPLKPFPPGRCARVVELRKGEVIVDVEALVEKFFRLQMLRMGSEMALRAALRKVGKR